MPKRTYWDRSKCKEVREVYKPKRRPRKDKYTSKAYKAAQDYHCWRFMDGEYSSARLHLEESKAFTNSAKLNIFGRLLHEFVVSESNRPGFMRTYMAKVNGTPLPSREQTDTPWYHNYKLESPGTYKAKKAYPIPPRDQWVKWKAQPDVQTQESTK